MTPVAVMRGSRVEAAGLPVIGSLLLAAAAVGALVASTPIYAAAVVLAAGMALLVAVNISALPVFLVFTMFVESLSLGPGFRIGRLAGAMALAVLAYYLLMRGKAKLRPNALLVVASAYGFWIVLSVYWADDSGLVYSTTASYLLAIAYMLAFAVLVRSPRQLVSIFRTLTFGSLVFGVLSFVTYFTSNGAERASGLQGDPNYFAVYQVIALPAALTLAGLERRLHLRLVYYGAVGVIVLSVVSSLSRTGLLTLGVVVLATLLLPWRVFFRRRGQRLSYALALLAAAAVAAFAGSAAFIARAQSILNPSDRGSGRTDLWAAAWNGYHQAPWLGLGAGNFQAKSLDLLQTTPGVDTAATYVAAGRPVHNAYLEALTELGPLGLALFALVILLTAWSLVTSFRRARSRGEPMLERFSLTLLVSLIGFALSSIFLSNGLGKPLWILVGLSFALDAMVRRAAPSAEGASIPGAVPGTPSAVPTQREIFPAGDGPDREPDRKPDREPASAEEPDVAEPASDREFEGREYDLKMGKRFFGGFDRRFEERMEALRAEQERLERRQNALLTLERELRAQTRASQSAEPDPARARRRLRPAILEQPPDATAERKAPEHGKAEREQPSDAVTERALRLTEQEEALAEREQALARREAELRARVEEAPRERPEAGEVARKQASELVERALRLAEREEEVARHEAGLRARLEEELARREAPERTAAQRLVEREEALAEREEALARREAALLARMEGAEARARSLAAQEEALERREAALDARADEIELRARALENAALSRGSELGRRAAQAAEREEALSGREAALDARDREPEHEPERTDGEETGPHRGAQGDAEAQDGWSSEPVSAQGDGAVEGAENGASAQVLLNLNLLERLVDIYGGEFPDRTDEWRYYLIYLRDFASPDGQLPSSFGWLVHIFHELLDRAALRS